MRSLILVTFIMFSSALFAQTAPPPAFDEDTKGTPAVDETAQADSNESKPEELESTTEGSEEVDSDSSGVSALLGDATITETRGENGQLQIELDHSAGSKQYLRDDDSDGKIQATDNDLDTEPNLPKWRLGRW